MEARTIRQDKLLQWIGALVEQYEVIAPRYEVHSPGRGAVYGKIGSAGEIIRPREVHHSDGPGSHDQKPAKSLKEFLFAEREVLLEYRLTEDGEAGVGLCVSGPSFSQETRIILGAYPCDVAAFPILDKLFAWDYLDAFYLEARDRTIIISMTCENPCDTCFCTSLGGSPADIEGTDILLTPLGEVYHAQVVTERGRALVEEHGALFEASDPTHDRERRLFEERAIAKITDPVDVTNIHGRLDFDDPVWNTLTAQCIDCGICTFLCPTCHCFDIQDEASVRGRRASAGQRVRLWDACMFYNYTKAHAGQPRAQHYRRYRQRIMHKFRYYPENFDRTLCVGCGRCIEYCPVSIDLRQVLRRASTSHAEAGAAEPAAADGG